MRVGATIDCLYSVFYRASLFLEEGRKKRRREGGNQESCVGSQPAIHSEMLVQNKRGEHETLIPSRG